MAARVGTTTLRIGMIGSDIAQAPPGFTLVELILVMGLLATVMAFSAPSLSRSLRQRYLNQEAARFLALTEHGRDEAVSQGIPMVVWVDPKTQRFGLEPKTGYTTSAMPFREYTMNPDIQFEIGKAVTKGGIVRPIEFAPDGLPTPSSVDSVRLVDRFEAVVTVARTIDGWGYEILQEAR